MKRSRIPKAALCAAALALFGPAGQALADSPSAKSRPSFDRAAEVARRIGLSGQLLIGDGSGGNSTIVLGLSNRETNRPHRDQDR